MLVDYHTHHYRCGHASGTLADVVECAIERGLSEIGLSDHSPIFHFDEPHPFPKTAMHPDEFPNYVREMAEVRDQYKDRIQVRLGVESDYILGWDDFYRDLWAKYPLDYVIGSVHWLERWNVFWTELPEGKDAERIYHEYFESVQAAAQSGIFDILGHLDVPKTSSHMTGELTPLVRETLEVIADSGVAIELNTSGWRKPVGDCYPSREILGYAAKLGIPVTLGSDAHSPELVGAGFDRALALLHECGFKQIAAFSERKRTMFPIEEALAALKARPIE